uniref:Mitochondrial inner membrane protein Mpv17 n=1 Tax=Gasterosteus aculeatus aculeatus TaxID=481459 RepID=A0AAQ4QG22_GASAC
MAGLWRSYQVLMTKYPWTVQLVTAGSLVGVGDVISQQLIERRGLADHNVRRTAKMMGIGFFFVGPVIGSWYKVLDRLVVGGTKSAAMKKMLVDQLCFAPGFLGAFLCISGALNGLTLEENVTKLKRAACGPDRRCHLELLPDVEGQQDVSNHHKSGLSSTTMMMMMMMIIMILHSFVVCVCV